MPLTRRTVKKQLFQEMESATTPSKPLKGTRKRKGQLSEDKEQKKQKLTGSPDEKTNAIKEGTKRKAKGSKSTRTKSTKVTKEEQSTEELDSTSPEKPKRKRASSKQVTKKDAPKKETKKDAKPKGRAKKSTSKTKSRVKIEPESSEMSTTKSTKMEKGDDTDKAKKGRTKKVKTGVKEEVKEEVGIGNGLDASPCFQSAKFIGAHMGIAGGLDKAVIGATEIGAKAFALFLRSQRQWQAKPLDDKVAEKFRNACKEHKFSPWHILPHGSYLLNCGSPNPETLQKSRDTLTDELKRCEKLGLALYNFHPGSTCGLISVEECLDKIGESINIVHKQTNTVVTVIENMSRQGNTVGGKFEELKGIIDRVEDKSRVGVCLDTCHAFAAGFDLATESGYLSMMEDFERIVGLNYLKAVHLNDSKGKVGSHRDRHENIGKGHIGLKAFRRLMNDPRFDGIPIVLETPAEDDFTYQKEIRLLYSMQDTKK